MTAPIAPGMPVGSTRLTGNGELSDEPLTVEDWRIVHHAYLGFITVVRQVVAEARKREQARASQDAPATEE